MAPLKMFIMCDRNGQGHARFILPRILHNGFEEDAMEVVNASRTGLTFCLHVMCAQATTGRFKKQLAAVNSPTQRRTENWGDNVRSGSPLHCEQMMRSAAR